YLIGEAHVNKSYLNIDKIIDIANKANVDAIHPGYGLLSENPLFSEQVEFNGITFIGPTTDSMKKMSSKIEARKTMSQAVVPIVPYNSTHIFELKDAKTVANQIGYPIMLKASSGGGGIGMQIINNEDELEKTFNGNQKRANDFFGDGSMFIEKL